MKMKTLLMTTCLLFIVLGTKAQESTDVLIGTWKLDMSPHIADDDNFAMMKITSVKDNELKGTFYREGVKLKEGQINTQRGIIYGALISGDNSGSYNTSFYFEDGKLYGSTHAIDRGFLAVWIAEKQTDE